MLHQRPHFLISTVPLAPPQQGSYVLGRYAAFLGLVALALGSVGCKSSACEERPAEAQISVRLEGIAPEAVSHTEVELTFGQQAPRLRQFEEPQPSLVFEFKELDRAPREVRLVARAISSAGQVLGAGSASHSFTSDGCNNFVITVRPPGTMDGGVSDRSVRDSDASTADLGPIFQWSAPQQLNSSPEDSSKVDVAVDDQGNAMAVWLESVPSTVWANSFVRASHSWGAAELIQSDLTKPGLDPHVAMDSNGNAIALWVQQTESTGQLVVSRNYSHHNLSWKKSVTQLNDVTGIGIGTPRIAMDSAGNGLALWTCYDSPSLIQSRRFTGVLWDPFVQVVTTLPGSINARLALSPEGLGRVAWKQNKNIWTNSYKMHLEHPFEENLGTAIQLSGASTYFPPQVAIASSGLSVVLWGETTADLNIALKVANFDKAGQQRGATLELGHFSNSLTSTPGLAITATDDVLAVWHQEDAPEISLRAASYSPGCDCWGVSVLTLETQSGKPQKNRLAMDERGNAMVVWTEDYGGRASILANTFRAQDKQWLGSRTLQANPGVVQELKVAINRDGSGVVVWAQPYDNANPTRRQIWAVSFERIDAL